MDQRPCRENPITGLVSGVATATIALFLYARLVPPATAVSRPGRARQLTWGTALGVGLFTLTMLLIVVCGGYRFGGGSAGHAIATFGMMLGIAACEEILHLGWNFAESGLFGTTVSGSQETVGSLFTGTPHGAALISGGGFGPEASIFAVLVGGVAGLVLLLLARRRGMFL